jgi:anti-anti-sigma factor
MRKIDERTVHGVTVLDMNGRLAVGAGLEAFHAKMQSLVEYRKNILLNFQDVPYIDSSGLGDLLIWYRTIINGGGKLKLMKLTERNVDLLAISKLLTVFDTFEHEPEAIKSFGDLKD